MSAKPKRVKSDFDDSQICPKCEGRGYVITEDGAQLCECQEKAAMEDRLKEAHIPKKYLTKELASFETTGKEGKNIINTAKAYVQAFDPDSSKGILLMGPTGCGKTHIAVGILKELIRSGYDGLFCDTMEFFKRLHGAFVEQSLETENSIIDEVTNAQILLFDDFSEKPASDWIQDRLYLIINYRYNELKPTLITTRCSTLMELQERVGDRIVSRLCEMCNTFPRFPSVDYRRAKMK